MRFEPERGFLHAKAAVTVRAGQSVEAIEFELNPRLQILEVSDALGRRLEFERSRRLGSPKVLVWLAELPKPPDGDEHGVTVIFTYEGVLPRGQLDYISPEGILLRDEARWYPALDLAAFTMNDFKITVPSGWAVISSGHARPPAGGEDPARVFRWRTPRPVSSRSLVAAPLTQWECGDTMLEPPETVGMATYGINACVPEPLAVEGDALGRKMAEISAFYKRLVGPYRQNLLTLVPGFPGTTGATGFSAPGFLVVSEDSVRWHDYPGWAPEFLPHEVAHQWFPIEVTLARPEDGWLAEGLADYLAWRYLQEKQPEAARKMVERALRDALAPEPLRPLSLGLKLFGLEEWEVTHATLYQQGMLVFRTLETVIGRARVDAALREYYRRFAGRSASIADFRAICEEIARRDLKWFFDYFIEGTEIPEIALRHLPSSAPNEVAGEIVVRNVPPEFSVRVELRAETPQGPVVHSVATHGEATHFTFLTPAPATRLTLDPEGKILRWTEAARRHRLQQALLRQAGEAERDGRLAEALRLAAEALALDPENLASNEQLLRFLHGRLFYRLGQRESAWKEFEQVLRGESLDAMGTDFYRAWARVYRARIAQQQRRLAVARTEAEAGLTNNSPAMETPVAWPESRARETSARQELRAILPTRR